MLVKKWILEHITSEHTTFQKISDAVLLQAKSHDANISLQEIRAVTEHLIKNGTIDSCQYLAEEKHYAKTVYDKSNIYWYFFKLSSNEQFKQ
jgi:hypothetical protein